MRTSINLSFRANPEIHLLLLLTFFYGFAVIYMPQGGGDFSFWSEWAIYIQKHGIRRIYELHTHPAPGQPPSFLYGPVYMYLLYFFGKWQGAAAVIENNIYQLKRIILLFDLVGIWFALRYLQTKANRPFYALFLVFNMGLLYNTITWGQVDGALACLTLVAVYYALRGNIALSGSSLFIGLLIKPQPIVFLPLLGILWLTTIAEQSVKRTVLSLVSVILVVFIMLWPFLQAGTFVDYWAMLRDSSSVYPSVAVNAANIWPLIMAEDPNQVSDELVQFGLTYKQWGLLMFSVSYFIILFPLLRQFYQIVRGKRTTYDTSLVLLVAGLIPVVFYFFNTQMHERYAHSSVLLLGAYALVKGDFIPYIVVSIANFCVMDKYLKILDLRTLYKSVSLEQIAVLFLFVLIWCVIKLYKVPSSVEREIIVI